MIYRNQAEVGEKALIIYKRSYQYTNKMGDLLKKFQFYACYLIWTSKKDCLAKRRFTTLVPRLLQITYCNFYRSLGTKNVICLFSLIND